jgi:glutathionylspermidine synthase
LPAFESPAPLGSSYVRKPLLGREGANITIVRDGRPALETPGVYGDDTFVYQELVDLPAPDGNHPVLGVWVVDHEAAGLGIREDASPITGNLSRFVPHFFRPA